MYGIDITEKSCLYLLIYGEGFERMKKVFILV